MESADDVDSPCIISTAAGVSDVTDDAGPTLSGPLEQVVRLALSQLRDASSSDADEVSQTVSSDLVTAYSQLDKVDRQTVDKQLVDILYMLTTGGFDVNALCDIDKRQTALHVIASVPDSARFIRALHAAGAKMNAGDRQQQSPLHIATRHGDARNVTTLIDSGANVNQRDSNQQSPLHLATKGRRQVPVVMALIRGRADVRQRDSAGHTPLHVAVRAGRLEVVRELISRGKASVNKRDFAGMNAIHLAAMFDVSGEVMTQLLRSKSAHVNARDSVTNETPLHKAMRLNMVDCVRILLRRDADVNIANTTCETPLHLAAAHLTDLTTWNMMLRDRTGADVDAVTASGLTVREVAVKAKNSIARVVIAQFDELRDVT